MCNRRVFEDEVLIGLHDDLPDAVKCIPYAETHH